jgi:hypothetical protein
MCLNGSFKMTAFRNRLLGLAASTLALSSFTSMAYAQTTQEVLNFTGSVFHNNSPDPASYFTFDQSMILNNIGWVYDSSMPSNTYFGYQRGYINSSGTFVGTFAQQDFSENDLDTVTVSGLRYLKSFTAQEYASGTVHKLTAYVFFGDSYTRTGFLDNAVGVTHSSNVIGNASGNLRVTAPGNIAPEPGSLALALTGGAALLGICIRRRRNAA